MNKYLIIICDVLTQRDKSIYIPRFKYYIDFILFAAFINLNCEEPFDYT